MPRKHIVDAILDQARNIADSYNRPLGDVIVNFWFVAQQHLHQCDPQATIQIQEALAQLTRNEITPEDFSQLTNRSVDDLVDIVDVHQGLIPRH